MDLSDKLADVLEEASMLDRNRASFTTDRMREIVADLREAAKPLLAWISESQACVRSGMKKAWFRRRFPEWERQGYARWNPKNQRERQYLLFVVPTSHDDDALVDDARMAARESMSS